jgi:hypothetical protein
MPSGTLRDSHDKAGSADEVDRTKTTYIDGYERPWTEQLADRGRLEESPGSGGENPVLNAQRSALSDTDTDYTLTRSLSSIRIPTEHHTYCLSNTLDAFSGTTPLSSGPMIGSTTPYVTSNSKILNDYVRDLCSEPSSHVPFSSDQLRVATR